MQGDLKQTACHEAGHAVMARIIRWEYRFVTIRPGDSYLGQLALLPWPQEITEAVDCESFYTPQEKKWAAQKILLCLSGSVAEQIAGYLGGEDFWNDETRLAYNIAAGCCIWRKEEGDGSVFTADAATKKLLLHHWPEVELLTAELLKRKELKYSEVEEMFGMGR